LLSDAQLLKSGKVYQNPALEESLVLQKTIESRLDQFIDPWLMVSLAEAKLTRRVTASQDRIQIDLQLGYPHVAREMDLVEAIKRWLLPVAEGREVAVALSTRIRPHAGKLGLPALPQVKNIIAVASGKGGVGKSTVSVNVALALAKAGAKVGLLDADIYGPSQPLMFNTVGSKPKVKDKTFMPVVSHGIQTISMGYLIDEGTAMVWRGPMIGKALQQLMFDTAWDALDYLIVDLPPGTGDIQLTLCQKMPLAGAIIVTTPQDVALSDVKRACEMFSKLNVPMLGVVENMSVFHCTQCGHAEHLFGEGGGVKLSEDFNLPLLASIPLARSIREMTDAGQPPVLQAPDSAYAKAFDEAAYKAVAWLSLQPEDYSSKFPNIVVTPR
jgi:ATP-binding protein involved in chromosome partitioning